VQKSSFYIQEQEVLTQENFKIGLLFLFHSNVGVLGSARTRLIFTGTQEGAQLGADPTWTNRAGYSVPCAVILGSGGVELGAGNALAAQERGRRSGLGERLSGSCGLCCSYLYRCCSCSLCLLFC